MAERKMAEIRPLRISEHIPERGLRNNRSPRGTLGVGEAGGGSLAASAPSSGGGLRSVSCGRFDRLKGSVPIWKKKSRRHGKSGIALGRERTADRIANAIGVRPQSSLTMFAREAAACAADW